jgi:general stress protein 26
MSEPKMDEIKQLLAERKHTIAFLATVDAEGYPQVRPLTLMTYGNDFFLATGTSSRKAAQIMKNDRVEFVTLLPKGEFTGYLRVMGHAERVTDSELARKVAEACDYPVEKYWQGVEDSEFFMVKIKPIRVEYMKPGEFAAIEVTSEYVD